MPENANTATARDLFAPDVPITSTRDRITATALNLFYAHGFHAVGIDQIIRDVGVTKTTFYNHFQSKDDLMVAAIRMRDAWESESFRRTVDQCSDGTPTGAILALFDALDLWFTSAEYRGCIFINACTEFPSPHHPVHQAAREHLNRTFEYLLERCRAADARDPHTLARQLELLLEGALTVRQAKCDDHAARIARRSAERLLKTQHDNA